MSSQYEGEQLNITLLGLSANLGMGLFKMIGGSFFHSQALKADGFHSLADSITDLTAMGTLYLDSKLLQTKSRLGKFEDIGAIAIASMVLAGGTALGKEALSQDGASSELASPHAIWLCIASVLIKEFLYTKTAMDVVRRIDSPALSASAAHHRLDSFTSIFALISIVAGYLYPNTQLIDPVCGGLLAAFVLKESVGIIITSLGNIIQGSQWKRSGHHPNH
ncbi:hypothetical protein N7488_000302 [Penicillium malachiteum]|nr:hypothetical protein N7488_000302 [Penicillium malachiteum]